MDLPVVNREMSYKIQKWNVMSAEVFPILLANARVDWLGIEDREVTQHFPILLEGILRDVFSQRASAAWQGAPPQKVTVSILLPGRCTSDLWLDYLQSQRHFWPSMTTLVLLQWLPSRRWFFGKSVNGSNPNICGGHL